MKYPIFFLLLPIFGIGQLMDDFSSGSLAEWEGEVAKFIINAEQQLQLNDTSKMSPAQLFRAVPMQDATTWELYINLDFAPSSSNFAKIILQSDQTDTDNFQGYFLKIGGIGGTDDAIELFRQDRTSDELLISGTLGGVGNAPVEVSVKVERDAENFWTLAVDYNGESDFMEEGSTLDDTYHQGAYFGLECRYTSTRSDKFFFDDLKIDTQQDEQAPNLLSAEALSSQQILLMFDENLQDNAAISTLANYQISPTVNISDASLNSPNSILLELGMGLQSQTTYEIVVNDISDGAGNQVQNANTSFLYIEEANATFADLLINEIMADPSPVVGLPELEYVELYNRSEKNINLEGLVLSNSSRETTLPNYLLLAGEYVLLYEETNDFFDNLENSLQLEELISLRNSGDELSLQTAENEIIHSVNYNDDWYGDGSKDDGGFSLELINPLAICDNSASNWRASESGSGGTPGMPNSVLAEAEDLVFEGIQKVELVGEQQLRIFFSESVEKTLANDAINYQVEGLNIAFVFLETPNLSSVLLEFDLPLDKGIIYTLTLNNSFSDCLGNLVSSNSTAEFALPALPESQDLVINEVLFNPATGGSDFVELYNRSDKIIDLQSLVLADANLDNINRVETSYLLFPQQYVVLTESPTDILNRYEVEIPEAVLETDLPSLGDKEGSIVVYVVNDLQETVIIDAFEYSNDFHSALLDDENGVSLERLNPESMTQDENNWHSAAAQVGFATPTAQNSQFFQSSGNISSNFRLTENVISPDNDGFQDLLLLEYEVDQVGYLANIRIFDSSGRLVGTLSQNELIATEGAFKWDGTLADGTRARMGVYIMHIEYFSPNGTVRQEQLTFVIAARLD
ncbi:MAG: lamin tail domain-containing protein [Bacteroidota bacterium]